MFTEHLTNELQNCFIGIVEDNIDPRRIGRCKVRVHSLFDQLDVKDIPYASPIMSLDGTNFSVPAIGKLVNIIFEHSDLYSPVYHYAENYNYNLQKKLNSLSDDEYNAFSAMAFDHKVQIYQDKNELTIDYFVNKITVSADNINLELKDNSRQITLGSKNATQQAILGNHLMEYLDQLVTILQNPLSLTGNLGAPVLRPELDTHLAKYWQLRSTFLSNNVSIVDNNQVSKLNRDETSKTIMHDKDLKINGASLISPIKVEAKPNQLNPLQNNGVVSPNTIQNIKAASVAEKKEQLADQKYQGFGERNFIISEDQKADIDIINGDQQSKDQQLQDYSNNIEQGAEDLTQAPIADFNNVNSTTSTGDYSYDPNQYYQDDNYGLYKANSTINNNDTKTPNSVATTNALNTVNSSIDPTKYMNIRKFILAKGYAWRDKSMFPNFIWYRSSYIATNKFTDTLLICYMNTDLQPVVYKIPCTTKPGLKMSLLRDQQPNVDSKIGTAIIVPGQYVNAWEFRDTSGEFSSYSYFRQVKGINYWRDGDRTSIIEKGQNGASPDAIDKIYGTHWHRMSNNGTYGSTLVNNWSEGCCGTAEPEFAKILPIVRQFVSVQGKLFTGTIIDDQDFKLLI